MPKPSKLKAIENTLKVDGGAIAVDRALAILKILTNSQSMLSLADLSRQSGLYKSTVLRLIASLEGAKLVKKNATGTYGLGAEVLVLGRTYKSQNNLSQLVIPVLESLVKQTKESAAFHILQNRHRLCLYRVDSEQLLRDHIKVGDLLPANQGSGGHILLAFSGAKGKIYDEARKNKVVALSGDRVKELAGISAPVMDSDNQLLGAITLTMPSERFKARLATIVKLKAKELTEALGGEF